MRPDPTHAALSDALQALRLGVDASDLHGSLTGYLCAAGRVGDADWPTALKLEGDAAALASHPLLQQFLRSCRAQFESTPARIEPLLPAPEVPLPRRAAALVEWCRGFLGGFGLAGMALHAPLSDDAREILGDFGAIAGARFAHTDAGADATALAEVLEFVRTAAALLHRDVRAAARAGKRSLH
ncbi:MAG: UPF0149 family protein [Rhodanobacteraceae bacterium]|jgi:hypothetical protein|nr:UPF0149 family protein [Rhodanobacteraceae bacterium]